MDHIGGLLRDGKRVFPKAKVLVAKPEFDAWMALAEKTSGNEVIAASAAMSKAVAAAYGADIQTFAFGDTPLPGVTALDAAGHTPGHTAFQLTAAGKNLIIVGDLVHAMPLQFALPDECASFDMDPAKAIQARNRIFALAAKHKMQIAGMHFPFVNVVGTVTKDGKGWKFKRTL
jgi:glyoxylase-like metal-dependent hydrolase (beta-lactamase superfamily II)